jgi:DNA-binding MarR family transcriptional regulator
VTTIPDDARQPVAVLSSVLQALDASGMIGSELRILVALCGLDSTSVKDLGEHVGVSASVVSRDVERLVRRGLAERREDPSDRRRCIVSISDAGRDWLAGIEDRICELIRVGRGRG